MSSVLGFDFSTQQVKAVVLDAKYRVTHRYYLNFDKDLPHYKTTGGVHVHSDGRTVTAPTIMWVEALDAVLKHLQKQEKVDFSQIKAISGCAQQHGSVFWKNGSEDLLNRGLTASRSLKDTLLYAFSVEDSPVWMDSSTTAQCKTLEEGVGGAHKLVELTGARAYERFTGSQIAKIHSSMPTVYDETERISLVSSFVPSLLLGKYAPIDLSDGSGMNLLNLETKTWDPACARLVAPSLHAKLGDPVFTCTPLGPIAPYFVERYGFRPDCQICAFTGDNPGSLIGMHLSAGEAAISLGTSDTTFSWLDHRPAASSDFLGSVTFCNPASLSAYMSLICWKNGSLVRENVKNQCCSTSSNAGDSWASFADLLGRSPPGNDGNIGFFFEQMEIQPHAKGIWRFDADDKRVEKQFPPEKEARALIEGQMLGKKLYLRRAGFEASKTSRIILTGGASQNKAIAQIVADIFQANVYTQTFADSAAYGGACIAAMVLGWKRPEVDDAAGANDSGFPHTILIAQPRNEHATVYDALLKRFEMLQKNFVESTEV